MVSSFSLYFAACRDKAKLSSTMEVIDTDQLCTIGYTQLSKTLCEPRSCGDATPTLRPAIEMRDDQSPLIICLQVHEFILSLGFIAKDLVKSI